MFSPSFELWWAFIVGTIVLLMLGTSMILIIISSQRRFLAAQKEKMAELRKSEKQYSDLFDNVSDIVYIHSLDGEILKINAALSQFLGYDKKDLIGKTLKDIIAPKYHKDVELYLKEISQRSQTSGHFHLTSKDGQDSVFEFRNSLITKNGQAAAVRGIARNVTEQKAAMKALRESEERFRRLIKFSPVPIAVHSGGKWVYVNEAGIKLIGASSAKAIIGKPVFYFIKPETRTALKTHVREILEKGTEVSYFENNIVRQQDGKEVEVEVVAIPIIYDGQPAGQVVVRDITERKRLQNEIARSQRLETAGLVAGQIAHDFNNLLAPLTAYPTLIREDLPKGHSALELVDDIEAAANKIAEINQQLLALGRRGHYSMEVLDLNDLLQTILNSLKLPPGMVVNTDFTSEILKIKGGGAQLTRAFTNLIINAKEAMQGLGVLTVKTQNVYLEEPLQRYQTVNRGEYVKTEITDTGTGIEPKIFNKIFDPFFTTKKMDRMRGSGLGLSIVHGIIEDHEGYITIDSELGKGTTFSLYFPVYRTAESELPESSTMLEGKGERILVVDDDPVQREVASHLLQRLGYQVSVATSGEEAVKIVQDTPHDLVILDMVMDGIDGAETYRQILKYNSTQKAIILSGFAVSQRVEEAISLGAGGFVPKPISPKNLANAIRKELDRDNIQEAV
ncbi:MAG: PAS domain S-box protein [bacterium]